MHTIREPPVAERWRYTWHDLVGEVIETGLCTGCSGCVISCPQHVLSLENGSWTPRLAPDACSESDADHCRHGDRGCTLCARACPRFGSWEIDADVAMWSRPRSADEVLGVYRRALLVEATDQKIAVAGQDGGLGTALLLYAIENDYIDAALVSYFEEGMRTRPGLARTKDELLACAGSRYTYSSNLLAIDQVEEPQSQRLGVISVGCQTSVPAIARSRGANKLAKRFALVVGLLCSKTFSERVYEDLLEANYGVARRSITKVNIKGRLQVWHTDTEGEPSFLEVPLSKCSPFTRPRLPTLSRFRGRARRCFVGWDRQARRTNADNLEDCPGRPASHRHGEGRLDHRDRRSRRGSGCDVTNPQDGSNSASTLADLRVGCEERPRRFARQFLSR